MTNRKWRIGLLSLAFIGLVHASLLTGCRRLAHDTFVYSYPWRVFLSDSLVNGVFPFWDSFSSPGGTTVDLGNDVYYPVAILFGLIPGYDAWRLVIEIVLTGVACLLGAYRWLRRQPVCVPVALTGALAYSASAPVITAVTNLPLYISMCYFPWVLFGIDLVLDLEVRARRRGVLVLAVTYVLMLTGGYPGLTYMITLVGLLYAIGRLISVRFLSSRPPDAVRGGPASLPPIVGPASLPAIPTPGLGRHVVAATGAALLAAVITVSILAVPILEFMSAYGDSLWLARAQSGIRTAAHSYHGHLPAAAGLTLGLPNGSYLPGVLGGWAQIYVGALTLAIIPTGFFVLRTTLRDRWDLAIAAVVFLASLGPTSWVARFFVAFVPGYTAFRWRTFYCSFVALLLVGVAARLLHQFASVDRHQPAIRRRFAVGLGVSAVVLVGAARSVQQMTTPGTPLVLTAFDWRLLVGSVVISVAFLVVGLFSLRKVQTLDSVPRGVTSLAVIGLGVVAFGMSLIVLCPPHTAVRIASWIGGDQRALNTAGSLGLRALAGYLDTQYTTVAPSTMWALDAAQVFVVIGLAVVLVLRAGGARGDGVAWMLLLLVLCDLSVAAVRYAHGNTYWITSQIHGLPLARPSSVDYAANVRDASMSNLVPGDWTKIQLFENQALQFRRPTYTSHGGIVHPSVHTVMRAPAGTFVFSRLLWNVPFGSDPAPADWKSVAQEPEISAVNLRPNRLDVTLDTAAPVRLVWTDAWAPEWRVSVNGERRELHRVLGAVKAVDLAAGRSTIAFVYQPTYLWLGMSALGSGVVALIWLSRSGRRRSGREGLSARYNDRLAAGGKEAAR